MSQQQDLIHAMTELNEPTVLSIVSDMISAGCSNHDIQSALNEGVSNVGRRFEQGEYFIADLIVASMIYRSALGLVTPRNMAAGSLPIGRCVIGVPAGDIHDIGKDIVASMLRAERFEVFDLGIDVKPSRFAYAVRTYQPDVLLLSGVLTTTIDSMKETIDLLKAEGLRDQVSVFIGGLCAGEHYAQQIGADGWAYDTMDTLNFCKKLVEVKHG